MDSRRIEEGTLSFLFHFLSSCVTVSFSRWILLLEISYLYSMILSLFQVSFWHVHIIEREMRAGRAELRRLVVAFPPPFPEFDPKSDNVGFVVENVSLTKFSFNISVSPTNFYSIKFSILIVMLGWCNRAIKDRRTKQTQSYSTRKIKKEIERSVSVGKCLVDVVMDYFKELFQH